MLKFAVTTLGCKVNQYEERLIVRAFTSGQMAEVTFRDDADIYIINSCAITKEAENKARQIASSVKGKKKECIVILAGCYATRLSGEEVKNIDILVGQADKNNIFKICIDFIRSSPSYSAMAGRISTADAPAAKLSYNRARAQLKIQDGCKNFCSYCIVPYIRNKEYSVPPAEVIEEIVSLNSEGYREIVLTGIHLGKYDALDIDGKKFGFEDLLKMLDIYPYPGELRIRLSSLDPSEVSEKIILLIKNSDVVVPHFHLALQSGSDKILKLMDRRYSREDFIEKIAMIEANIERAAITSDVIVGFPGESEEDFQQTFNLLNELPFYDFHIFKYCERPGTKAVGFEGKVSSDVKKDRSVRLHELKKKKNISYYEKNIGTPAKVIAEKVFIDKNGGIWLAGHSERYIETLFKGGSDLIGRTLDVKMSAISDFHDGMLAELI